MINKEAFTGRAQAYTKARPSYPKEVMEYINKIIPPDAVVADIGAGTGKFTELLAKCGYEVFAIEPNADMLEQLAITLKTFPNTKIAAASAEDTTLPDDSVDVITCAQTLNRVDIDAFRSECQRIGKNNPVVISLYNYKQGEDVISHYKKSTEAFYQNPLVQEFPNPVFFTRDKWLQYFASMEGVPLESDAEYEKHIAEINEIFDRDNVKGVLQLNLVTAVYSEKL